jgi:hypothetical protein
MTLGVVMDVFRSNVTYRFLSIRNSFVQEKLETLIERFIEEAGEENNQHGLPRRTVSVLCHFTFLEKV